MSDEVKKEGKKHVSAETFISTVVDIHKNNGTYKDCATALGLELASFMGRYYKYRKLNVDLPKFTSRGAKKLNVDALNTLIKEKTGV